MRKRLVIGAIAAVVIGVATYVLSPPRRGRVEWHEREYWSLQEHGPLTRIRSALGMDTSVSVVNEWDIEKKSAHETALLKSGRWVERIVLVSSQSPEKVLRRALPTLTLERPIFIALTPTNGIRVVTCSNDAVAQLWRLERLIGQADVPETK